VLGVIVLGIADKDDINTCGSAHRLLEMCRQPLYVTLKYTRRKRGRKSS
jgi:hypothetical protein